MMASSVCVCVCACVCVCVYFEVGPGLSADTENKSFAFENLSTEIKFNYK